MRKIFIKEMQDMQFSPRFIRAASARKKPLNTLLNPRNSFINARLVSDDNESIKRTQSIIHPCPYFFEPFFRSSGTELIQDCKTFAIYRERCKIIIVFDDKNCMKFNYKSIPLIIRAKMNTNIKLLGLDYNFDILFLSFPCKSETIALISEEAPIYFVGLPFGLIEAGRNEATLACGLKASIGLELLDTAATSLTFSF